ncbi:hypothetical protein AB0M36_22365 [Actinoplanes sp. NPDC051346]|uniref:hypothetical protein n=1 Tax=Actinoplanes sp. NPDC051346 TaxID=3155048 RepID=UPI003419B2B5
MATHGNRRATVVARVVSGTVTPKPDPARSEGWTVCVDGVPQSYVDLGDPTFLAFEYVRRLATVLRVGAPTAVPLRILHLGRGGLTPPPLDLRDAGARSTARSGVARHGFERLSPVGQRRASTGRSELAPVG